MPEITLTAETGRQPGSSVARRLRAEGKIPGVIYGHGIEPIPVAVEARSLRNALMGEAGLNALLNLEVGSEKHLALAVDLQRDPVRGVLTHVDFQVVRRDEVMTIEVPVNLIGEPKAVLSNDGVVAQELFTITIHSKPGDIPPAIDVDISALTIGESIRIADIALPSGCTTDLDPEHAIVVGQGAQVSEADLIAEPVEGAEPAGEPTAEAGEGGADAEASGGESGGGHAAASEDSE